MQLLFGAVEWKTATQQHKEDDSGTPDIDRPPIELSPDHLRRLVVWCAHSTWYRQRK